MDKESNIQQQFVSIRSVKEQKKVETKKPCNWHDNVNFTKTIQQTHKLSYMHIGLIKHFLSIIIPFEGVLPVGGLL